MNNSPTRKARAIAIRDIVVPFVIEDGRTSSDAGPNVLWWNPPGWTLSFRTPYDRVALYADPLERLLCEQGRLLSFGLDIWRNGKVTRKDLTPLAHPRSPRGRVAGNREQILKEKEGWV